MNCASADCAREADRVVYWPGQTTAMCGRCAHRAAEIAKVMGFELVVGKLEDWPIYRGLAHEAAQRLRGEVCGRCGGRGGDPEHQGPCGECGAIVRTL